MNNILVLGTIGLDTVKTPHGKRKEMLGGSAVHFSMGARLFSRVILSAVIGEDFPKKYLSFLEEKNLSLASLIVLPGKTFRWHGEYCGDLNCAKTLTTELGVLTSFMPTLSKGHENTRSIFLANIDPDIQAILLDNLKKPRLIGLDSMNFWIDNKRKSLLKVMKRADLFVANDQEARSLSGEYNLIKAGRAFLKMGPEMVVIKKGEHGLIFVSNGFLFCLPAYPVEKVIDPTGAGDTFAGALMGYLASRPKIKIKDIKRALGLATVAASFNVEGFGIEATSVLKKDRLDKRLVSFRSRISF